MMNVDTINMNEDYENFSLKDLSLKNIGKAAMKYSPLTFAARQAYYGLLAINAGNLATRSSKNLDKAHAVWKKWGGEEAKLDKYINIGKNKKPLQIKLKKKSGFDGSNSDYYFEIQQDNDFSNVAGVDDALIIAASGIIVAMLNAFGGKDPNVVDPNGAPIAPPRPIPDLGANPNEEMDDKGILSSAQIWGYTLGGVAGVALLVTGLYFAFKKD
jgi:hypothetical protein